MNTHRAFPVLACVLALSSVDARAQRNRGNSSGEKPTVEVVQSVGCVERKQGNPDTWWLSRASEPRVTQPGVFAVSQIDAARRVELGSSTFQLVGVADFLDADGLLKSGQRREFTNAQNANATGELKAGRKVLVKGMFITRGDTKRINLLNLISLAESCGQE
jgi:hypothetical protein